MIKQKNIFLFFTLIFILVHIASGKGPFKRKLNIQPNFNFSNKPLEREFNFQDNHNSTIMTQTDYFLDTFDSDLDGWTIDNGWNRTDIKFHSPDYSINSFENNQSLSQLWQLTSSVYTLPEQPLNETIHYSFWIRNDMLDGDGDGDEYLDDHFSLSLLMINEDSWNTTTSNSYDGRSYWCGDEELNGYGDTWVQYLDTPEVLLAPDSELTAMMKWAIEDTDQAVEENIEAICENGDHAIDGWDQVNVQISTDGGSTWVVLSGNSPYDFQCGYGTVYNGFVGLPGWSGILDWHEVTFDLSNYANQNVIIRFAFYSDPSWSTIDDDILTGLQIDDIQISSHDVLFSDNADNPQMIGSGENWIEQLYDYWDDGSEGDPPQPGSLIWEEYKPGTAFDGNILQNLTEYAGYDIKFRFQAFFDGNTDGGIGTGLFVDDFRIYSESTEFYPSPSNLIVESNDANIELSWSDLLNYDGDYLHILDSGEYAIFDETTIDCSNSENCITYMGNLFYVHGNSSVDSVFIYNKNDTSVEVSIAAFSTIGQLFSPEPSFVQNVTLSGPNAWNGFSVEGWNFINPYIIAHTITDEISISLDTEVQSFGAFFDGYIWNSRETVEPYFTAGIRAKITKESSNVTYNIYRIDDSNSDFIQLVSSLPVSTYVDDEVVELQEYIYGVSATYPENNEESLILIYPESISILPASYQELSWDDGSFESSFELEQNDSLATKFRASSSGQQIVQFKWYQIDDGGAIKIIYWANSEDGFPGNILDSKTVTGAVSGWNYYDLSEENWSASGDFWIGLKAFSTTPPIGIDYNMGDNSSVFRDSNSNWSTIDNWNLGIRIFLDCASENIDECGICDGDNSTCLDCAGVPNGSSVEDCAGLCNGEAVEDCTGVCSGLEAEDCTGECAGGTLIDECGICGGSGPTADCGCDNIPTGACDCEGHTLDECYVCGGDNSSCTDCLNVPNGDAVVDECGVCSNTETHNSTCTGCMNQNYDEYDEDATIPCEDCCSSITLANNENIIPSKFEIINLYPNPFNPQINIEYNLPTTSNVRVSIYNVKGQKVDKLVDSIQHTGTYSLVWIASDYNSGIYFVQITADTDIINRKIMLLK